MSCPARPGGLEITKRAFDYCGVKKAAKVLDIGSGNGDTAGFLKKEYGFSVTGIDRSPDAISLARENYPGCEFMEGDGQWLDFESLSFDCVLMECTLSLMPNPVEAIHEAFCVLKEDGWLIVHDLYLPHPPPVKGALVLTDINAALDELGFEVTLFEDRKADLDNFVASLIFEGGDIDDYRELRQSKSEVSYFLLIARKG